MKVLICYSGYLGTTKKIAYYIEEKLKEKNVDGDVIDLFETNKIWEKKKIQRTHVVGLYTG